MKKETLGIMFVLGIVTTVLNLVLGSFAEGVSDDSYFVGIMLVGTNIIIATAVLKYIDE